MAKSKNKTSRKIGRDAKSGQFISVKEAHKRPNTTVVETIKPSTKAKDHKVTRKTAANAVVGGYKVVGKTSDGVRILKPRGKPKSFTVSALRKAISSKRTG